MVCIYRGDALDVIASGGLLEMYMVKAVSMIRPRISSFQSYIFSNPLFKSVKLFSFFSAVLCNIAILATGKCTS